MLVKIPMKRFVVGNVCLPLFGLFFAVVWSLLFEFEKSTETHCNVPNYLPSVSAAIGYRPQAYVWRICIALHVSPRFLYATSYWSWYSLRPLKRHIPYSKYRDVLVKIAIMANYLEVSSLLGLTMISSREDRHIHEICFGLFMTGSLVYMLLSCLISSMVILDTKQLQWSYRLKKQMTIGNISSFILAMYFFVRHNAHCEPGVYTLFALCEYFVIFTNCAFHYALAIDQQDFNVVLCDNEEFKVR